MGVETHTSHHEGDDERTGLTETVLSRPEAAIGGQIGPYRVRRLIGSGGVGTVYEASQENPKRSVAVKVLRRGMSSPKDMRRFEYESQILARLRHPGIAQVYEAGYHEDVSGSTPYFAMEYVPAAQPITEYAEAKGLSVRERVTLFLQVCRAVQHGHQKGIIHRDLKPRNILVDAEGGVKIIDFGVARCTEADPTQPTEIGERIGTLTYMSPEQIEANPESLDIRSDVYALGVVLYELLSGTLPYDVESVTFAQLPSVILHGDIVPLHLKNRALRGDVERIVSKALELKREHRYQSAHAMEQDLERYLRCEPILARPSGMIYRAVRYCQREWKTVTLAAALLIVGVAALGFYVDARRRAEAEAERRALQQATRTLLAHQAKRDADDITGIIADCNRAIEEYPKLAFAYALRGKMWQRARHYSDAMEDCDRALTLDPSNSLALRTKAYLHLRRGEFKEAEAMFGRGMQTMFADEYLPEDYYNRARLWRLAGKYDKALEDHDRAIAAEPTKVGVVYVGRGITRYAAGDYKGAIADWSKAAALDSGYAVQCAFWKWEAYMRRGDQGDKEKALSAVRAVRDVPTTDWLLPELVKLFLGESDGEFVLGVATLKAASDEDWLQTYYYLAVWALIQNDKAAALDWFRQCLKTGAHGKPEYDLAHCHLEQLAAAQQVRDVAGKRALADP